MSHTPVVFDGTPTLTPAKVEVFKDWYVTALGNFDMATTIEDRHYHQGIVDAMDGTLKKLYNISSEAVVESKGSIIRPLIIVAAVGTAYLVWRNWDDIKKEIRNF